MEIERFESTPLHYSILLDLRQQNFTGKGPGWKEQWHSFWGRRVIRQSCIHFARAVHSEFLPKPAIIMNPDAT